MDEDLKIDPVYQNGFNSGYLLAKDEPALFDQLVRSKNEHSQFFQGMKAGGKEYLKERFKIELQRDKEQREHNLGNDREREKE